jgi:DNA-binding beta-propeller fold protein YncE
VEEAVRKVLFALIAALFCFGVASATDNAPLKLVTSVDLPKYSGDFDHFAADLEGNRLFLAAEDHGTLEVFDLKSTKWLKTVKGFDTPHSILYLPAARELFVTDGGESMSKVLSSSDLEIEKKIALLPGADSLAYDADAHRAYVVTGGKDVNMKESVISVIDTTDFSRKADLKLDSAHVEAMALEANGNRMFVNITDQNQIFVIDRDKMAVIDRWPLKEAGENSPMIFDQPNHRLFIVCRKPAKLVVFDTDSGKQIGAWETAGHSDGMAFDSIHKRIYVPGAEGYIAVYRQKDADHYELTAKVPSAPGAKTCLLVPELNRLYVAVSPGEGKFGARVLTFETLP